MEWKSEGVQPHRKRFRERGEASKQLPIHFCIFTEFLCPRLLGFDDFTNDYHQFFLS